MMHVCLRDGCRYVCVMDVGTYVWWMYVCVTDVRMCDGCMYVGCMYA